MKFKKCSSLCDTATFINPFDYYFLLPTDTLVASEKLSGTNCFKWIRAPIPAASGVNVVWAAGSPMARGAVCRVEKADGTVMDFSDYALLSGPFPAPDPFADWISWNCPTPKCGRVMDIVLVVDESGSISTEPENCTTIKLANGKQSSNRFTNHPDKTPKTTASK